MSEKKSKLAQIKTKPTNASVKDFINTIPNEQKRNDSFVIMEMMKKASGKEPKMWGPAIIGFGKMIYKSPKTTREVECLRIGFSPRKANLTLYISIGFKEHAEALKKLGKHKTSLSCLHINKLEDIDLKVLKGMIEVAVKVK